MAHYSPSAQILVERMRAIAQADPDRALAYQGAPGANSDIAAQSYDPQRLPLPCYTFEDAIEAVRKGTAAQAIIPIENNLNGRVADIHFLLPESGLHIVGEYFLPICYGLMSRDLGPIQRAISHVQALGQCRGWLRCENIEPIAHNDTADAAALVADSAEVGLAAIAPPLAAELYGLTLHAVGIEDADYNMTRFVVLARDALTKDKLRENTLVGKALTGKEVDSGAFMTTFIFEVKNIPAALYKALGGFATNAVNMTKLESYQLGGGFSATKFYADIIGMPGEAAVDRALEELRFHCNQVILLGSYRQARPRQ